MKARLTRLAYSLASLVALPPLSAPAPSGTDPRPPRDKNPQSALPCLPGMANA